MIRRVSVVLQVAAAFAVVVPSPTSAQVAVNPHGTLPAGLDCSACHTPSAWSPLRETPAFEHGAIGGFVLTGAHTQVPCASCHLDLRFDEPEVASSDCASCHMDVHEGAMTQPCAACHDTRSFHDVDGDAVHARTAFPLTGAHRQITCESCHVDDVGGSFTSLPTDCVSCHQEDFEGARTVDHVAGGYPTTCTECHNTVGWADAPAFDHAAVANGFTLVGAHTGLRCASCHAQPGMEPLFTAAGQDDCVACHQADFDREHGGSSFSTTCLDCHNVDSWEDPDFDHGLTGFSLLRPHDGLECSACHTGTRHELRFPRPAAQDDCVACHQADYDEEHAGSGFPTTCLSCHRADDWDDPRFDHAATAFPLEGAHAPMSCADCHTPPALAELPSGPTDCVACHQADYDEEHGGAGFPVTCLECHTQASWEGASFDHATVSDGFVLAGRHASATCEACHAMPGYGLLFPEPSGADDCAVCHQSDYDGVHGGSAVPLTCGTCHGQDSWEGATADHALLSNGFTLVGSHAAASCEACHTVPGYGLLFAEPSGQGDCVACHRAEYDGEHGGSAIPTTCGSCHGQTTWEGATADHTLLSNGFALQGPHASLQCTSCHAVPGYTLLFPQPSGQNDCVSCHQADYDANHAGSGFPTACLGCHSSNTWSGATLDHVAVSGGFQLLGSHAVAQCTACHSVPGYGLLFPQPSSANDCVACHQTDFDGAHGGSGYPTDCAACHNPTAWEPSTFDHDAQYFPIYSGPHREEWSACTDCHAGGVLSTFTCLTCHEHSQSRMDDKHKEEQGYSYTSAACLSCHPTGRSG